MDKALEKEMEKVLGEGKFGTLSSYNPDVATRHTGSYRLDLMMGGGLVKGGIIQLQGQSAYGKTTVASIMMKAVQEAGEKVAFVDFEHTYATKFAVKLGLDPDMCEYIDPDNGDEGLNSVTVLAGSGEYGLIVIDSIPAARPRRELQGEVGDANVGSHAKMVTNAMNAWLSPINKTGCSILCMNHRREDISSGPRSKGYAPGGKTLEHNSMQIIRFLKPEKIEENGIQVGFIARMKMIKSKLKKHIEKMNLKIHFDGGVDRKKDIINTGVVLGIIERSGAWYSYGEEKVQGKEGLEELDDKVINKIEKEIIDFMDNN